MVFIGPHFSCSVARGQSTNRLPNQRRAGENGKCLDDHLSEPAVQFCVSFVTMNNVAEIGLKRVVASWNWHSIEGKKRS